MSLNRCLFSSKVIAWQQLCSRSLHLTSVCYVAPTRAKKKVDPIADKVKEDRKRRRYEKAIDKLEKFKLQLKPIHEYESERRILKELE